MSKRWQFVTADGGLGLSVGSTVSAVANPVAWTSRGVLAGVGFALPMGTE